MADAHQFERGFADAKIGMAVLDPDLRLVSVNQTLCLMLGRAKEELVGRCILEFTHTDDIARSTAWGIDVAHGSDENVFHKRYLRPDGTVVDATVTTAYVEPEDGEPYYFSQLLDVTEQRRVERETAAIAALGRLALTVTEPFTVIADAVRLVQEILEIEQCLLVRRRSTGELRLVAAGGETVDWNAVVAAEGSQSELVLRENGPIVSNDLLAETRFCPPPPVIDAGLRRGAGVPIPERAGLRHVLLAFATERARALAVEDVRFLEAVANVIGGSLDRAAIEDELRRRALEDPLTGLANRALLMSQLERELRHASRMGTEVCVLLVDLDRFKSVNDTLGHGVGDALLRQVAARLRATVRDEDIVARLGGDEFVVVCTRASGDRAIAEIGGRLIGALNEPFALDGIELPCHASIGIAVGDAGETPDELLRDADAAMYRAKQTGGARCEVFDADLRRRLAARLAAERDLSHAVERDELELHYQPLIDLASEEVLGFEALVRWRHPERGFVAPVDFIGIAEETGLIIQIGTWVLHNALEQLARWPAPITMSINLSAAQISHELVDEVEALLEGHGLEPDRVVLEITESLVLDPGTKPVIQRLRELGVHVALDDFGTGYSTLGSLQRFPLDVLKLDRSLIAALDEESGVAVVNAALELGRALGLRVVAEGIEVRSQLDRLRTLGCSLGQGYMFARPLPRAEADAVVAALT